MALYCIRHSVIGLCGSEYFSSSEDIPDLLSGKNQVRNSCVD